MRRTSVAAMLVLGLCAAGNSAQAKCYPDASGSGQLCGLGLTMVSVIRWACGAF